MKGPITAIFLVLLVAACSIWLVTKFREKKELDQTRLSVRKMVLSLRLNPQQEEKIVELECSRKLRVKQLQDSLKKNQPELRRRLEKLTGNHQKSIESLLDSSQIQKYRKYRLALARKKARNLRLFRKKKHT